MSNQQPKHDKSNSALSRWQALAIGMPSAGMYFLMGPMGVIQGIYAKYFGLALTTVAVVLVLGRFFDAVTDPLIAYYSDLYRARYGTRKPFVLIGGLGLIPCSYFLFIPPENVSAVYFMTWMLLFYLFATIKTIPTNAWASESTSDSIERTTVFTALAFLSRVGGLLFFLVPFLPMFTTTEITPETLKVSVLAGAVLILPGLYCALKYAPNGPPPIIDEDTIKKPVGEAFSELYQTVKSNKPFQVYMAAYMCVALSVGMYGGLLFIFVDAYLGQGAVFAQLAIISIGGGLLLTPVAFKAVIFFGKKPAWMISTLILLGGFFYTGQLSPGKDVFIELLALKVIFILGTVMLSVIALPMLSGTIDYALLYDRTERRAAYFSVYSMVLKAENALGLALGLAIAGWLGFDATATTHNEQSSFAIHMAISWIPCVFISIGLYFIWRFPLDERRSAIIHRRLAKRISRQMRVQSSSM